jgi:hypothetical protein
MRYEFSFSCPLCGLHRVWAKTRHRMPNETVQHWVVDAVNVSAVIHHVVLSPFCQSIGWDRCPFYVHLPVDSPHTLGLEPVKV